MKTLNFLKAARWLNIVVLAIFMLELLALTSSLQGMARTINCAGLVRGETQQLVKLELAQQPNQIMLEHIDTIVEGLRRGGTLYHLSKIPDREYQQLLVSLNDEWHELRREIYAYRLHGQTAKSMLDMSEVHFQTADRVVYLAAQYSERIVGHIFHTGIVLLTLLALLVLNIWYGYYWRKRQRRRSDE